MWAGSAGLSCSSRQPAPLAARYPRAQQTPGGCRRGLRASEPRPDPRGFSLAFPWSPPVARPPCQAPGPGPARLRAPDRRHLGGDGRRDHARRDRPGGLADRDGAGGARRARRDSQGARRAAPGGVLGSVAGAAKPARAAPRRGSVPVAAVATVAVAAAAIPAKSVAPVIRPVVGAASHAPAEPVAVGQPDAAADLADAQPDSVAQPDRRPYAHAHADAERDADADADSVADLHLTSAIALGDLRRRDARRGLLARDQPRLTGLRAPRRGPFFSRR
jgi:hypothetical protein